jgi:DNA-binding transcriptional LysR family regulator
MHRTDALQVFVRVAEMGSFTRAAARLGLPKASASVAVRQLEAELGVRLLHRTTRSVRLTHDGEAFCERARAVLADLDELHGLFRDDGAALRGRLRVDMPTGTANNIVIPALPAFLERHPGLELELGSSDRRVDLVQEGFDCVLRVGPLADSRLVAHPLGAMPQRNYASPGYLRWHGVPQGLDDLAAGGHRMVHYLPALGARPLGWEYADADGTARALAMPGALRVANVQAYEAACVAGLGLIQAPRAGMQRHLDRGDLVEVLPGLRAPPLPVSLVVAHRRGLSRRVRVFMAWMREVLEPWMRD